MSTLVAEQLQEELVATVWEVFVPVVAVDVEVEEPHVVGEVCVVGIDARLVPTLRDREIVAFEINQVEDNVAELSVFPVQAGQVLKRLE